MGLLCACSFANVSEHIHLSYLMQWISLHLWGAFLVCKPPPHKKKDIQLLFAHLKAKWHSTRLCLSLLPFAFVIYHFYAVVSVSTLTPYYKLIHFTFFTDRSQAERREAVRMEGCQRRHLCEPHQCTARLTSDVSSLAICLTPACKLVSGQFDNTVMPAL